MQRKEITISAAAMNDAESEDDQTVWLLMATRVHNEMDRARVRARDLAEREGWIAEAQIAESRIVEEGPLFAYDIDYLSTCPGDSL